MEGEEGRGETDTWVPNKKSEPSEERFNCNRIKELAKRRNVQIGLFVFITLLIIILVVVIILCRPSMSNAILDPKVLGDHKVLYKEDWKGAKPKYTEQLKTPVSLVVVEEIAGASCFSNECPAIIQKLQNNAMEQNAPDIYNNFMIANDANIYVGRGWNVKPQEGGDSINIGFTGNFNSDALSVNMTDAAKLLLELGVKRSKLSNDYKLVCYNQIVPYNGKYAMNLCSEIKK